MKMLGSEIDLVGGLVAWANRVCCAMMIRMGKLRVGKLRSFGHEMDHQVFPTSVRPPITDV